MNEFYQKDIISIKELDKEKLEKIFVSTDKMMIQTNLQSLYQRQQLTSSRTTS